jgi:two-component system sensor histidine kinase KdpD
LYALCRDGREVPVDISLSPLRTGEGLLVCAAIRDISERKHAEEALKQRDRLTTTLLRSAAHDFRSPLTAIATAGEASILPTLDAETRVELGEIIVGEATRLSRVVGKLLDLSRLECGSAAPQRAVCSIETIIASAVEQVRADEETFTLVVGPDVPEVWVDPAQLERAIVNLLENARRFANCAPVRVCVEAPDGGVVVRVADDGPGIPATEREHIFEPFIRIGPDRAGGGSGLGLAIAKGFVEANDGRIFVEPLPPGRGTTFVIELPIIALQPALVGQPL